ncbi:Metaxin-1 [Frankliniella fusca]|uniref:Metaxin-1 n=1 Tax=Frankliniella fusca TaxID=407009 RepID=A0AAE1LP79_9NEOP|nr:Metaxin-1 [Frankliniella fusca]
MEFIGCEWEFAHLTHMPHVLGRLTLPARGPRGRLPALRLSHLRRVAIAECLRRVLEVEDVVPQRQRRWVVRPLYSMRRQWGAWYTKIPFMRENDEELFFNFLRVTPAIFDELLAKVRPYIENR